VRNLDTTPAPVEVLAEIVERVGDEVEVLVDGGVRRGTDIVKALALGARAVLIGRPVYLGAGSRRFTGLGQAARHPARGVTGCPRHVRPD
jgi:isopentenyl diphosphate isomerase/L-lactate dehydrogenase-like FMN-dependent dehydrogenase